MGIILLGYRGSGKTTVARLLSDRLRQTAIDTDEQAVRLAGMSIRDIFQLHGEEKFRELESIALREACANDVIVSLGGGAVLREQNRDLLQRSGHERIYLRCDARILHDRIHADPTTASKRPSLTHLGGNLAEIQTLLAQRDPLYRQVMTRLLDVDHLLPQAVADAIVAMLQEQS